MTEDTLYDQVHRWTYHGGSVELTGSRRRQWDHACLNLRIALRQAKRFQLDADFTREAVRKSAVQPPRMLSYCHLANLPFEKIWLEYPMNARIDAQFAEGSGPDRQGEERGPAAFLIERIEADRPDRYRITNFGYHTPADGGPDRMDPDSPACSAAYVVDLSGLLPYLTDKEAFKGSLSPAWGLPSQQPSGRLKDVEDRLRGWGWGYGSMDPSGRLAVAISSELTRRGGVCLEGRFFALLVEEAIWLDHTSSTDKFGQSILDYFSYDVREGRGTLCFIMTMLAMINVCPVTYVHKPAQGSLRHRLRNIPYLDSHVVTIRAGRRRIETVVDKAFRSGIARHNKRHGVRGHWALAEYGHGGRACLHLPVEREDNHALCGSCGRLIVWRENYERGDASLGYVNHTYEVTR